MNLTAAKFYEDMQMFFFSKDVVAFAATVTIGFATRDVILAIIDDLFVPLAKHIFHVTGVTRIGKLVVKSAQQSPVLKHVMFALMKVGHAVIVWLIMMLLAFLILEYVMSRKVLGLKTRVKESDKTDFIKSKVEARVEPVIPLDAHDVQLMSHQLNEQKRLEETAQANIDAATPWHDA